MLAASSSGRVDDCNFLHLMVGETTKVVSQGTDRIESQ